MNTTKLKRLLAAGLPISLLMMASGTHALPGDESPQSDVDTESCFFGPAVSSDRYWNYVYADSNAIYQCSSFDLQEGDKLTFEAEYPHARYMSWTFYGAQGGDQIIDVDIEPDPGRNTNPYINGNDRNATNRSYTINLVSGDKPKSPKENTLYNNPFPAQVNPFGNFACVCSPSAHVGQIGLIE